MTTETLWLLTPEIVLIAAAVLVYLAGAFVDASRPWPWLAGAAVILAAIGLGVQSGLASDAGGRALAADGLAVYARWLALVVGGLFVMLASRPLAGGGTPEYLGSLLLATAGLMLAAAAEDLVLLFVSLELVSIPTYILLYLGRRDAENQESATKYFFLSVLASAMLLYGFSFLYGVCGTTDLGAMCKALRGEEFVEGQFRMLLRLSLVFTLTGLGFKAALVPFHFYAADVYQGTTHANAGFLSVVPKAVAMLVLVRLLAYTFPHDEAFPYSSAFLYTEPHSWQPYAWRIALVLAVLTMTLGNVMALWQDNLRRLLAYSSIAHAGYMLIGLAVGLAPGAAERQAGIAALLFYLGVYALATIGTFAALAYLGHSRRQLDSVDELAGLGWTRPGTAALIAVFMFSLAGIPPLAGFWGKLVLFFSALGFDPSESSLVHVRPWFLVLAVIGVLNAAVAAAYYLRIVGVMYFRTPLATPRAEGGAGCRAAAVACAVLTLWIGLFPGPLMKASDLAGRGAPVEVSLEPPATTLNQAARDPGTDTAEVSDR